MIGQLFRSKTNFEFSKSVKGNQSYDQFCISLFATFVDKTVLCNLIIFFVLVMAQLQYRAYGRVLYMYVLSFGLLHNKLSYVHRNEEVFINYDESTV